MDAVELKKKKKMSGVLYFFEVLKRIFGFTVEFHFQILNSAKHIFEDQYR